MEQMPGLATGKNLCRPFQVFSILKSFFGHAKNDVFSKSYQIPKEISQFNPMS